MNIAGIFIRPFHWLASRLFAIWARPAIQPESPADLITDSTAAICYVLETGGLADLLALDRACRLSGLPSPHESLKFCGQRFSRRFVVLRPLKGFLFRHPAVTGSRRLRHLVDAGKGNNDDLLLIPVAIYWGRSPDKERSLFKLLFSENWDVVGRTRKFFATLIHGRNTLLRFSDVLALSAIVQDGVEAPVAFRKVSRILRVHFRQRRAATVGPDLSRRQTISNQVLLAPAVRRVISAEAGDDHGKQEAAERRVHQYVEEIAADISYPTIRILMRILKWLWNKIYDGIELNHIERLHDVAKDKVIVYTPCHRSHFDYLLLSYICCQEGIQLPHIAAGINLNLPLLGPILRRGGAFYLRRSFKGNRLYATVFDAYLYQLLARGYSLEYFVDEAAYCFCTGVFRIRKIDRRSLVYQRARRRSEREGVVVRFSSFHQVLTREFRPRTRQYW
jgi:glycerol-3-phosphate O-acyltransferase